MRARSILTLLCLLSCLCGGLAAQGLSKIKAGDAEQDRLRIKWILRRDSGTLVGGGDAHAVEGEIEADLGGDVSERKFAVVAVEGHSRPIAGRGTVRPVGGVNQQQVLIAVAVVVEEGDATTHGLG